MDPETRRVFEAIAEALRYANHGFDYGDMDAEAAFSSATSAVAYAIDDALRLTPTPPSP